MAQKNKFTIDLEETFPMLSAAPVVEAIIHWQAPAGVPLEQSVSEILKERLENYPTFESVQNFMTKTELPSDGTPLKVRHSTQWQGFILRNEQNTYAAQFTSQGVIFSRLQPYEKWDSFVQEAMRVWNIFLDIAKPIAIQRLGVRYINRIPVEYGEDPSSYFSNFQGHLSPLGLPIETFFHQDVYRIPGYPYYINWTCAKEVTPSNDQTAFILDIDVYTTDSILIQEGILDQKLKEMRWLKDKTFFTSITKSAKETFGG
jgi:uncharacterized protein (TIGR04255 family)